MTRAPSTARSWRQATPRGEPSVGSARISDQGTDGVVSLEVARLIGTEAELGRLLAVGLLEEASGGYALHDFLEYNPSAREVAKIRKQRAEAGSKGASRRGANAKHVLEHALQHAPSNAQAVTRHHRTAPNESAQAKVCPVPTRPDPSHPRERERSRPSGSRRAPTPPLPPRARVTLRGPHDGGSHDAAVRPQRRGGRAVRLPVPGRQRGRRGRGPPTPDRFYLETDRRIFEACVALASDSSPVDPVTVGVWLREHRRLEQVGGLAHLVEIVSSAPALSPDALRAYATAVRNCATLRDVLATCQRAAAEDYHGVDEIQPFVQDLEAKLHDLTMARRSVAVTPMKEVLRGSFQALQRREQAGVTGGIPTGLVDLDFVTGGLHETDLTVVAARPGMGKTSFALQLAVEACRRGRGALFFSLEMGEEQIGNRILWDLDARVNLQGMRTGKFRPAEWTRLIHAVQAVGPLPLFVVDQADTPLPVMRTIVRRVQSSLARENGSLGVVVVDYLQLMTGRPGKHTRDEVVSEITRGP